MPFAAVNGIDVYFEPHDAGAPLLNISGSGNDLRRSPASILRSTVASRRSRTTFLIQDRTAFPAVIEFLESNGSAS